jgi:hypothetical protein
MTPTAKARMGHGGAAAVTSCQETSRKHTAEGSRTPVDQPGIGTTARTTIAAEAIEGARSPASGDREGEMEYDRRKDDETKDHSRRARLRHRDDHESARNGENHM